MKMGSEKLPSMSLDDPCAALLLHTFIFIVPLFSSFHSVHYRPSSIKHTPTYGDKPHAPSLSIYLIPFSDHAGLTHTQKEWDYREREGWMKGEDVGETSEVITERACQCVCACQPLLSTTHHAASLVPFTLPSL